jgi:tripeptidyl-peptidase I
MRASILLAAVTGFLTCSAAPTRDHSNFVLHEKRDGAPHQWTKRDRAHAAEVLPVRIGLVQSNLHKAEEYILDVSDPRSPNFGLPHLHDAISQFIVRNKVNVLF